MLPQISLWKKKEKGGGYKFSSPDALEKKYFVREESYF